MSKILSLNEYQKQREDRKKIRDHYNQRLADLYERISKNSIQPSISYKTQKIHAIEEHAEKWPQNNNSKALQSQVDNKEMMELLQQNKRLNEQFLELKTKQHERIGNFKQKFDKIKNIYLNKIKQISEEGRKFKQQYLIKIDNMNNQLLIALQKNAEIEKNNKKLQDTLSSENQLTQKYALEIKRDYDEKMKQFEQVLNTSNQKIKALQDKVDDEELVQTTLANQQIMNEIKENAEKCEPDVDRLFEDYNQLLRAKIEVCEQIKKNNVMKQKQVTNSQVLEQKMKRILKKMEEERQIYLDQNNKMSAQLLEVQKLLVRVLGQGE